MRFQTQKTELQMPKSQITKESAKQMRDNCTATLLTSTECYCPICEKKHKVMMNWIGRGIPRKFCRECKLSGFHDEY
jgi:transposase-like protein